MDIVGVVLPIDIVEMIKSYGDIEITNRLQCVHIQLINSKTEFNVLRHTPYNTYYRWKSHQFRYFILYKGIKFKKLPCLTHFDDVYPILSR